MNIEEIDKWLDNEYGVSYTRLEELHDFYFEKYCDLKEENQELKAELQLYKGDLKREHEAIHRVNELEEVIDKATNELFILKDMIYKPETREENFEIQRKISSIIKRLNGKEVE